MKVILLKELKGKGGEGDVIDVARGFANNYLLTQGYAIRATKGNLKQLEQRRNNIAKREETRIANANELAEKLEGLKVLVPVQVGEEGQLFGSVTSIAIADAINDSLGIEIDRHRVELGKPIKAVGEYPVDVSIYRNIKATVNVVVVDEKAKQETDDSKDDATDKTGKDNKATEAQNKDMNNKAASEKSDETRDTTDEPESEKVKADGEAETEKVKADGETESEKVKADDEAETEKAQSADEAEDAESKDEEPEVTD